MLIGCGDGPVIIELRSGERITRSRRQHCCLLEQSVSLWRVALMADLSGELHHRQRESRVVAPEDALLDGERLAKRLLRVGRIVDSVVGVAGSSKVIEPLQVAAAKGGPGGAA